MRIQRQWWRGLMAAVLVGLVGVTAVAAADAQFLAILGVREGAQRSGQIQIANGFIDYVTLLNARDGGINGVPLVWEECETVYDVPRGLECYEHLKAKGATGAAVFQLANTPLVNALIERATQDQIPLLAGPTGRSDASDGRVFPYVFKPPLNRWSQTTAKIRFLGQRAGGMDQLKGRKIVHVYFDGDFGRETIPILDRQAAHYGFTVQHLAVPPPGLDQKATWLRVKVAQPDWVILRSPRRHDLDRPEGSGAGRVPPRQDRGDDTRPARRRGSCRLERRPWASSARSSMARGDTSRSSRTSSPPSMPGGRERGRKRMSARGTGYWGMLRALLATEGIRTAMRHFGNQPLTGAQVQWGLEHLTLTPAYLKALGAEGLLPPLTLSCRDHEGGGGVKFQQWDGTQWTVLTDWIAPDQALVRPLVEASAAKYAQEKGITLRACP